MGAVGRNNVKIRGEVGGQPMLFAHGFGCDHHMWRCVAPAFEDRHRTVLFDHVGFGGSDLDAFDPDRYATLQAYADDVIEICDELGLADVVFVGHSVSAMIGALAARARPDLFAHLIMVCPSPRYINTNDYTGGFTETDIEGLLDALDSNYLGWSSAMAPTIMGNANRPELGAELTNSFCRTDPTIAKHFARLTFLSDTRGELDELMVPTLVLQTTDDVIAPTAVGEYVHEHTRGSTITYLAATGHCPNLSAPAETVTAIKTYLGERPA